MNDVKICPGCGVERGNFHRSQCILSPTPNAMFEVNGINEHFTLPEPVNTDYADLYRVLMSAYEQAAGGKGKERHARGKPFLKQPIMEIGRMVGIGYQLGQAMKKAQEAQGMVLGNRHDAAKAELLGAINYIAAAYIQIEEIANAKP